MDALTAFGLFAVTAMLGLLRHGRALAYLGAVVRRVVCSRIGLRVTYADA